MTIVKQPTKISQQIKYLKLNSSLISLTLFESELLHFKIISTLHIEIQVLC